MTIDIATAPDCVIDAPRKTLKQKMRGFTLIELGIVLTILAILALFAVPRVRGFLIGGKVDPTASELSAAVAQLRTSGAANGTGAQPYVGITIDALARVLQNRGNSLIPTVAAVAANSTVTHRLGAAGATLAIAAAQTGTVANGGAAGDSISITFNNVSDAACPGLANALQAQAEVVSINANVAKSTGNNLVAATTTYNAITAQGFCTTGDTNAFIFTFR